jgi:hypothetical protein
MFLVGAIPAFLCVFIQMRLKEPEKWVKAQAAGKAAGVKFGSYAALLGDPRWRGSALLGMVTWWSAQTWKRLDTVELAFHAIDQRAAKIETLVQSQAEFNQALLRLLEKEHGTAGSPR